MVQLSLSAPYNCSLFTNMNVTWMQMMGGRTVIGGYSHYWPNGTLHNYDLEGKLITIGNYTLINEDDADLCYEREVYEKGAGRFDTKGGCASFWVTEPKGNLGLEYVTEEGCLVTG